MLEFIELPAFTKRLIALAGDHGDEVLLEIENDLLENPERGPVIQGTAGVRKARVADPTRGKGKRGGFRYMYYYIERDGQVFLLMIFGKNEQADLTPQQKKSLRQAILSLREARR
ncbi:MAG TPA: type II toxin-antitoxin system RelE/ParE family toxin [Candidatus Dormibacteraeota bacterium]|nr:type II toxin-antitoxin system RelE/ParE family toxin [Candidatus Dormibacteraeota bacterium]